MGGKKGWKRNQRRNKKKTTLEKSLKTKKLAGIKEKKFNLLDYILLFISIFILWITFICGMLVINYLESSYEATRDNFPLMNEIKPEYLTGLNVIYLTKEDSFKDPLESFMNNIHKKVNLLPFFNLSISKKRRATGMYIVPLKTIKISIGQNGEYIPKTLCHELLHHQWHRGLPQEEKDYWKRRYDNATTILGKEKMDNLGRYNENEFRAYYLADSKICFIGY